MLHDTVKDIAKMKSDFEMYFDIWISFDHFDLKNIHDRYNHQ